MQLYGTKKSMSLFVQTFHTASPNWRKNYHQLSDLNLQPSEPKQLGVPSELFEHYRERSHVIYRQKITTYGALKTVSTVFLDFTAIVSKTHISHQWGFTCLFTGQSEDCVNLLADESCLVLFFSK